MAIDGYLVNNACVVTPAGQPTGQAALDSWNANYANHPILYNTGVNAPGNSVLSLSLGSFYAPTVQYANTSVLAINVSFHSYNYGTGTDVVYLPSCDSSQYPITGMNIFTPPVDTAIPLVLSIWLVWTIGYAVRSLIRTLRDRDDVGSVE